MLLSEIYEQPLKLNWDFSEIKKYYSGGDDVDPEASYSEIIWVNPTKLISFIDDDWRVVRGKNEIGNRLDNAIDHFKAKQPMTPPLVAYDRYNKQFPISVTDGRHRIAAAIELNQDQIPIAVAKNDIKKIQMLLK